MDLINYNWDWIWVNVALAVLGVVFGWAFLVTKNKLFKFCSFVFWILFLPNTIYLLTDLQYLPEQFYSSNYLYKFLLVLQYSAVIFTGFVTFILGLWPLERYVTKLKIKDKKNLAILLVVLLNILIAIGVVLGKEIRTNSWYVFTNPLRVIHDLELLFTTQIYLVLVLAWAVLNNLIYFLFNRKFAKFLKVKF